MPPDAQPRPRLPALIRVWLAFSAAMPAILTWSARHAHRRQAAAPGRFGERLGKATLARPSGPLVWVHAASVGEVASAARLARQIMARRGTALLVTTTTATGATTVARLVPGAIHQFLPVDTPGAVRRFLDHWRPDAALFIEGDLWPRMILSLERRQCPMVLVNARASRSRERFPSAYSALLARMRLITVQDSALIDAFRSLGLNPARLHAPGNLKADVAAPAVNETVRAHLAAAARGRGLWAAVSTHPGEETLILDAHAALPGNPLLVLVPRHPERGDDLAAELARRGLRFARHSTGGMPDNATQVHLMDVLGETGTVYAAAGLALVGGSLLPGPGGHTPYEPLALGCAIVSGPHVRNFTTAFETLQATGAARLVPGSPALGAEIAALLADEARRGAMQAAARAAHAAQGGATARTLELLDAVLPGFARLSTDDDAPPRR